jgi:hypothetical protein
MDAIALIHGIAAFDTNVRLRGVIFTQVPDESYRAELQQAVATSPQTLRIRFLGALLARDTAGTDTLERLAQAVTEHIRLEKLIHIANKARAPAPFLPSPTPSPCSHADDLRVCVAVAKDEAFSQLYPENLRMLEQCGASIVFFSPLRDAALPSGVACLYFGAGHPELHAQALHGNVSMRESVRRFCDQGGLVWSGAAGLVYLSEGLKLARKDSAHSSSLALSLSGPNNKARAAALESCGHALNSRSHDACRSNQAAAACSRADDDDRATQGDATSEECSYAMCGALKGVTVRASCDVQRAYCMLTVSDAAGKVLGLTAPQRLRAYLCQQYDVQVSETDPKSKRHEAQSSISRLDTETAACFDASNVCPAGMTCESKSRHHHADRGDTHDVDHSDHMHAFGVTRSRDKEPSQAHIHQNQHIQSDSDTRPVVAGRHCGVPEGLVRGRVIASQCHVNFESCPRVAAAFVAAARASTNAAQTPTQHISQRTVVSLVPGGTDLVCALLGDSTNTRLLGVSSMCQPPARVPQLGVYSHECVQRDEHVGTAEERRQEQDQCVENDLQIDVSALQAAAPSLVLVPEPLTDATQRALQHANVSLQLSLPLRCSSLQQILDAVLLVGDVLGACASAHRIRNALQWRLAVVDTKIKQVCAKPKVRVCMCCCRGVCRYVFVCVCVWCLFGTSQRGQRTNTKYM